MGVPRLIDRIFAHKDVPCRCEIVLESGERIQGDVAKISKQKAVIDTTHHFAREASIEVVLQLPEMEPFPVAATVVDSGENGLFLRFAPADPKATARLQTLLVECASRPRPAAPVPPPLPVPPATPPASAKGAAIPADLRSNILKKTRTVRSADLAARQSSVHVLGMQTIATLVQEAVAEALQASERAFDEEERQKLLVETEATLHERLEALKAENAGFESQVKSLGRQLERAQALLEKEKGRVLSASQFTMSDAGIVELEQRLGRLFDRAVVSGSIDANAEREMREVVARLLDEEREKISQKAREAQSDAIQVLERKVGRLAQALEASQAEREKAEQYARALEAAGGAGGFLKNLYKAGLADGDPNKQKKLELLKELVVINKEVREHMAEAGTLPRVLAAKAAKGGGAPAPAVARIKVERPPGREFGPEVDEFAEEYT